MKRNVICSLTSEFFFFSKLFLSQRFEEDALKLSLLFVDVSSISSSSNFLLLAMNRGRLKHKDDDLYLFLNNEFDRLFLVNAKNMS